MHGAALFVAHMPKMCLFYGSLACAIVVVAFLLLFFFVIVVPSVEPCCCCCIPLVLSLLCLECCFLFGDRFSLFDDDFLLRSSPPPPPPPPSEVRACDDFAVVPRPPPRSEVVRPPLFKPRSDRGRPLLLARSSAPSTAPREGGSSKANAAISLSDLPFFIELMDDVNELLSCASDGRA